MDQQQRPGLHATIGGAGAALQVAATLDQFVAAEGIPERIAWRVRVALDEIVANLVAHTMQARPGGPQAFDLWLRVDAGVVQVTIADDGPPFNPLLHPDPDVTSPLEVRKPGGLGIALLKSLMDDVQYERTDRNVLTLRTGIDEHRTDGT